MSSKHIRFDDDNFEYEPSDSENEYTQEEKDKFKQVLNGEDDEESDDEVGVYGVGAESSDDNSDIALSDVEGQEDNDLPDVRAWGKNKKSFYSTDYVDPDYGGFQGKDALQADFEEEEARNLQKQLMNEMDEDDFAFDFVDKDAKPEEKHMEELIKTDISKLSKRQRLELLHKESPEFFGLVEDFKRKMNILKDYLSPTLTLWKENKINDSNALEFVKTYQEVITNYCTNINMYLLLKASRVNVQNHPIIKRLFQYRKLLSQLDPVFEENIQQQVKKLLENNKADEKPKKVLKVLQKSNKKPKQIRTKAEEEDKEEETHPAIAVADEEPAEVDEQEDDNKEEEDGDSRRAITYQIAKNKGLTPHRNKLQRNPRVKHRNKYRKALIRRKGAVRTVRTETTRYGGELSGIKASVSKSIKIKS